MKPTAMKHLVLAKRNEGDGFGYGLKRFFKGKDNEKKRIFAPVNCPRHICGCRLENTIRR